MHRAVGAAAEVRAVSRCVVGLDVEHEGYGGRSRLAGHGRHRRRVRYVDHPTQHAVGAGRVVDRDDWRHPVRPADNVLDVAGEVRPAGEVDQAVAVGQRDEARVVLALMQDVASREAAVQFSGHGLPSRCRPRPASTKRVPQVAAQEKRPPPRD